MESKQNYVTKNIKNNPQRYYYYIILKKFVVGENRVKIQKTQKKKELNLSY